MYGLSFFTLGMVITLQPHGRSHYRLGRALWALAVFAFLHAFADWGLVFIPLQAQAEQSPALAALWGLRTMAGAISFGLLLHFGMTLLAFRFSSRAARAARATAPALTTVWLVAFFIYPLIYRSGGVGTWYVVSEVWSRYLLGLPAGLATAFGLIDQRQELLRDDLPGQVFNLYASAAFLGLYGITGGLVVPPQSFWPASVINSDVFFGTFGIPVELVRTIAAIGSALYTASLMGIFRIETSRLLFRAEEERAVFRDRERIARDLHDGTLQTLYGVGLGLRSAEEQLPEGAIELRALLHDLAGQLGGAVTDLRQSIMGLRDKVLPLSDLIPAVRESAQRFARLSPVSITLEFEGLDEAEVRDRQTPASFQDHILSLIREGLSNVVKHSGANEAQVMLALQEDTIVLRIVDEGRGFDPDSRAAAGSAAAGDATQHHGLRNLKSRTEQLGGAFRIDSAPGRGTRLLFHIPVPSSETPVREGKRHG